MKKFLIIISVLFSTLCLSAQPTSLWVNSTSTGITGYNVIKDWTGGIAVGACFDAVNNCNVLVQVPFSSPSSLPSNQPGLLLDSSIDNVYDMWIVGNEVFFCGVAHNSGNSFGYVGHTTVSTTGFVTADYVTFSNVSFICNLVAYTNPSGSGYKVVAVGRKPYTTESFVGNQFIIELNHNGSAFVPTYLYAFTANDDLPEYMTVTDSYVAITGCTYDTDYRYFVIRCDKGSPAATAQKYEFIDPLYLRRMPAPTIEHLQGNVAAVAYSTVPGEAYKIVIRTLDLANMTDINAQCFNIEAKNPTPYMAYFSATQTLVLLTSDNMFPSITSATSSFVYINPYSTVYPYSTTLAFQGTPNVNKRCYSIARLGSQHFMGYTSSGWYSHNQPFLSSNYSACMDRTYIQVSGTSRLQGSVSALSTGVLLGNIFTSITTNYLLIDIDCMHP